MSLEAELAAARDLDVAVLADAIESIGFSCTRCGACCKGHGGEHTATVFPDEVREIQEGREGGQGDADGQEGGDGQEPGAYDWRDVARPVPFGLSEGADGPEGETFEWALQVDDCGDCTFYAEGEEPGSGECTIYGDRPLICETYPFSVERLADESGEEGAGDGDESAGDGGLGVTEPMGGVVEQEGVVRAHECEGLGRDISRADAEELARALKERAVRELEEAIGVRDNYEAVDAGGVVVHDSEGQKRPDGTPLEGE